MSLKQISYQEDYRTGQDDILNSLFRPSLRESTSYWRAVGYFSSSVFEAFGEPLDEFVKRNGSIKLITSVELTEDDYAAIEKGLSHQEVTKSRIEQIINEEFVSGIGNGASRLAALLEIGRLEIQIAIPKKGRGIYHEKVGVFFDHEEYVAFSGSSNESKNAFENNYECIDVYPSWEIPSRALRKRKYFIDLWENSIHPEDKEKVFAGLARASVRKQPFIHEYQIIRKDRSARWVRDHVSWEKDEQGDPVSVNGVTYDITELKQAEEKREQLIQELQESLDKVNTLSGLLPICAWCKKLRDDEGYWKSVEEYITAHTGAEFTHGMCPECFDRVMAEENGKKNNNSEGR